MWISAEMLLTTSIMTALSVSARTAQETSNSPEFTQVKISVTRTSPPSATSMNTGIDRTPDSTISEQETISDARSPIRRPKKPAMMAPRSGSRTTATSIPASPLSLSSC
jgi:hypothetical protein